ncbi:MAG: hypothetical protein JOZ52_06860 [Acidobacteria bacterium]|nr:hypothetical protein [Acidobacteriota bacterium]
MTDEERQRQMDFIVTTLARVSAKLDATAESLAQSEKERKASEQERKASELERKADAVRISRLEDAFVSLKKLSERTYELLERTSKRVDNHESRIAMMEDVMVVLKNLLNRRENGAGES